MSHYLATESDIESEYDDEIHVTFKDDSLQHTVPSVLIPAPSPLDTFKTSNASSSSSVSKQKRMYRKKTKEEKESSGQTPFMGMSTNGLTTRRKRNIKADVASSTEVHPKDQGDISEVLVRGQGDVFHKLELVDQKYQDLLVKYQAMEKDYRYLQEERLHYGVALEQANKSIYLLLSKERT